MTNGNLAKTPNKLRVFIVSEDSSKASRSIWESSLAPKVVQSIYEGCQLTAIRFELIPVEVLDGVSVKDLQWAAGPSHWVSKNPKDRPRIIALKKLLAEKALQPNAFLFYHFDGDCRHSNFTSCGNFLESYSKGLMGGVQMMVLDTIRKERQSRNPNYQISDQDRAIAQCAMEKIIPLIPCYSIEAWLYQNFPVMESIMDNHHAQHPQRGQLTEWLTKPELIEEIEQIKDRFILADRHNQELAATNFPARAIYERRRSFFDSVERAKGCTALVAALKGTRGPLTAETL